MTRSEIAKLRREFLEECKVVLGKKVSALENTVYEAIFNKIIAELDKADGKIISNNKNIDLATSLDRIFREIGKDEYFKVIQAFGNDLTEVLNLNKTYYGIVEEDKKKIAKVASDVDKLMRKRIGLDSDGKVVKSGYLDRLITDSTLQTKIKEAVFKSVTSGKSFVDFKDEIKLLVVGDDKVSGGLTKHFDTFAFDTYAQFNRTASKLYAVKLDLQAFVYSGGLIAGSRCFCDKNNGKVFTTEEAEKWKDILNDDCGPIWDESKDGTYEPLVEMGGYGCRHTPDFISNSLAIRLRPDLENVLD